VILLRRPSLVEAVFLDRDGLINEELWDYVKSPEEFRLLPKAPDAIRLLNKKGILVIVVSNQAGIAKGHYDEETLKEIHDLMEKELSRYGARIDGIYYCPHHPDGKGIYRVNCSCRKPNPGMLLKAAEDFVLNLKRCWMVGDKLSDIEAGKRAGCKTILVLTGYGERVLRERKGWRVQPNLIRRDLLDAAKTIIDNPEIV
jgi:D,D-heptose 1,7-bisphosphate phosphatase